MTLIPYLARVHFADGILEEALHSELAAMGCRSAGLLHDGAFEDTGVDRLLSGLPLRTRLSRVPPATPLPTPGTLRAAQSRAAAAEADALIGLGGPAAMRFARALAARMDPPVRLILIPCLGGTTWALGPFVPISDTGALRLEPAAATPPDAVICDPTLTAALPQTAIASGGIAAIAACIEASLSASYNPPADGMALEGVTRGTAHLVAAQAPGARAARRELLAADLNGALAAQKGLGQGQALTLALQALADPVPAPGAILRLLIPQLLAQLVSPGADRLPALFAALPGPAPEPQTPARLGALFSGLGLPSRLADLGLTKADLEAAAATAATLFSPSRQPQPAVRADLRDLAVALY